MSDARHAPGTFGWFECGSRELGGTVIVPPTELPEVGTFSVFLDPGGAGLAVIQFAEGSS